MNNETIYVLENTHGVVETGTAAEVTRAWLRDDGGDYRLEAKMTEVCDRDEHGNEIEGTEHEAQELLSGTWGSKLWAVEIKESLNRRFVTGHYVITGETEEEAEADFLAQAFEQINKSRSFTVITKAGYDEMQAEIARQEAADLLPE